MTGFRNPIVAGFNLVRNAIQSPNFVTGVSGWIIRKDGTAEFANSIIRGILSVVGISGEKIVISSVAGRPQIQLFSPDGTNMDTINLIAGTGSQAQLGINSGTFTAPDAVVRYWRIFAADNAAFIQVVRQSDQLTFGGVISMNYLGMQLGFRDDDNSKFTLFSFRDGAVSLIWDQVGSIPFNNNGATIMDSTRVGVLDAESTAPLGLTTSFQDIPGASITFTAKSANAQAMVTAFLDCNVTVAGSGVVIGELLVDGVAQPGQIIGPAGVSRETVGQTWGVTGLAVGAHVIKLHARTIAGAGTVTAQSPHSKLAAIYTDVG